jgi:hypothetical protein
MPLDYTTPATDEMAANPVQEDSEYLLRRKT